MSNITQRIANYFQHNYEGIDETAPKFEITVEELREIAAINTERCRLLAQERVNYKPALQNVEKIKTVLSTENENWIGSDYMDAFEQIKRILDRNE